MSKFSSKNQILIIFTVIYLTIGVVITTPIHEDFDHSGDYPPDIINDNNPEQSFVMKIKIDDQHHHHHHQSNNSNNLQNDINEFIDLIPITEVKKKLLEYYKNDRDVQQIYDYGNGKEFLAMKKRLLDVKEINEFQQYLNDIGLNIKEIFHKLDNLLGISKMKPPSNRNLCKCFIYYCCGMYVWRFFLLFFFL